MDMPKIRVGPGLVRPTSHQQERPPSYVLIIQGTAGLKVIVENNWNKAAITMMHEALNGFSTVFSAAFIPNSTSRLFVRSIGPQNATYEKVASFSERRADIANNTVVELLC